MAEGIAVVADKCDAPERFLEIEIDHFKELLDDIILLILSFLPLKDAIRTGALSVRWKNMWKILPFLNISFSDFFLKPADKLRDPSWALFDVVRSVFMQRRYAVETFSSDLFHKCYPWEINDRVVSHSISLNSEADNILIVEHLSAASDNSADRGPPVKYCIWKELIWKMIRRADVLVMKYALFTTSTSEHIGFLNHLLLYKLDLVDFDLDALLVRCSILKSLTISECKGPTEFRISHSMLEDLYIEYSDSIRGIDISCQNLRCFCYAGQMILMHFTDAPHLDKIYCNLLGESDSIGFVFNSLFHTFGKLSTVVSRMEVTFEEGIERNLSSPLSRPFDGLRNLVVTLRETDKDLLWLLYLLEAAPSLECLVVVQWDPFFENIAAEEEPESISKPLLAVRPHNNLRTLEMYGFSGHATEIELILSVVQHATSLELINVRSELECYCDYNQMEFSDEQPAEMLAAMSKKAHLKDERARERAHRFLQHEIPPRIYFAIASLVIDIFISLCEF